VLVVALAMAFASAPASPARADDAGRGATQSEKRGSTPRRRPGAKPIITIYEFDSAVPEVSPRSITDMFVTALARSGAFAVAERARLDESVERERALDEAGESRGDAAKPKLARAAYVVTGAISELNADEATSDTGISVAGAVLGSKAQRSSIGLDVRVVEAATGLLVDAVQVRRAIVSSDKRAAGIGQLTGMLGKALPANVDGHVGRTSGDGRDRVMRACVEEAVQELVDRYASE
jgi:curli biogenesis system outer membrane secretion channel CsgG